MPAWFVVLMLLTGLGTAYAQENALSNGGFESWTNGAPVDWRVYTDAGGTVTQLTSPQDVAEGSSSISLKAPATGDRADLRQGPFPVTGGETYDVSFLYRKPASPANATLYFKLTYRMADGTAITPTYVERLPAAAVSSYQLHASQVVAPLTATSVILEFDIRNGGAVDIDAASWSVHVPPPEMLTFDKKPSQQANLPLPIDLNGQSVTGIYNGTEALHAGVDYWVNLDVISISRQYLSQLPLGILSFTVEYASNDQDTIDILIVDNSLAGNGPNLLSNSGFDTWSGTTLPSWSFQTQGSGSTTRSTAAGFRLTGSAVRLEAPNAGDQAQVTQASIPVSPLNTYRASFKYRTSYVEGSATLFVEFKDADGQTIHTQSTLLFREEQDRFATLAELDATAPPQAVTASMSIQTQHGLVWVDNAVFQEIANQIVNGSFERETPANGWDFYAAPGSVDANAVWLTTGGYDLGGTLQTSTASTLDTITLTQTGLPLAESRRYKVNVVYNNVVTSEGYSSRVRLTWLDSGSDPLQWETYEAEAFDLSGEWRRLTQVLFKPAGAARLKIELISGGGTGETLWDGIVVEPWLDLYKVDGTPATDIQISYEWANEIKPEIFWPHVPEAVTTSPDSSVWSSELIRRHFFGLDGYYYLNYWSAPSTKIREFNLPTLAATVGIVPGPNDPGRAFAGDIPFSPIVSPSGTGGEYFPGGAQSTAGTNSTLYTLTGDSSFLDRSNQMVNYAFYSQYKANGDNEFVRTHYPDEWQKVLDTGRNEQYRGGWDYKFNWNWTNVYGYTYPKHSPDGHVNSQIGARLIHSYQVNNDPALLDAVYDFAYYQLPRNGYNHGLYKDRPYYFFGYGPSTTGIPNDASNPLGDGADNVNAAKAHLLAKLGYLKNDPKMLELARGLLWYLAREYEYDGAFYYDTAENPLNTTRAVLDQSHEIMMVWDAMHAFAYLKEAGVDVGPEELVWKEAYDATAASGLWYQSSLHLKALKAYDGEPEPNETINPVTYVQVTGKGPYHDVKWFDQLGDETLRPANLDVRISRVIAPNAAETDWTLDSSRDIVLSVDPDVLEQEGIILPWSLSQGEIYRISYQVTLTANFDRLIHTMPNAGLNVATDSGSGLRNEWIGAMAPSLKIDYNVHASSMLSYPANLYFPFDSATGAQLQTGAAPASIPYAPGSWTPASTSSRIHFKNLTPSSVYNDYFSGSIYGQIEFEQFIEYDIYVPASSSSAYNVTLERVLGNLTYQVYIDNVQLPTDVLLSSTLRTSFHDLGSITLAPGWHKIRFETPGSMSILNLTLTAD
ncbi:hypothetical protein JCM10914_3113 [Paenibacillus sp. JCM 10914]|nr:hypothetical protein JCM10914_3113 [Paenibacillus sp. JCM 10914]